MVGEDRLLRQKIHGVFTKKHQLSLRSNATDLLIELLRPMSQKQADAALNLVIEAYLQQDGQSNFVDFEILQRVVQSLTQNDTSGGHGHYLKVISAFDVPRWTYFPDRKAFFMYDGQLQLHPGEGPRKITMFKDRYTLLKQRLLRHELFNPPPNAPSNATYLKLTSVNSLIGASGNKILFGMISELEQGKFFLEDLDARVPLELSAAQSVGGYFTENSFVLVEGEFIEGIFRVANIGFPPPEKSKDSKSLFGHVNLFGGPNYAEDRESLKRQELASEDVMLVILSDVWLDRADVLLKLEQLFSTSEHVVPTAFIFFGNFLSESSSADGAASAKLKECFSSLVDLILHFPALVKGSKFIFIPGPNDPSPGNAIPRPPLPKSLTERIRNKLPGAIFTTNPCRMKFCTQEIVLFREDLLQKFQRYCIVPPSDADTVDPRKHLVRTVIDGGHLSPLSLSVRPIYWDYDHTLRLYPIPDVLILADRAESYIMQYEDCNCLNPGSFPNSDFSFLVYFPATRRCDIK